MVHNPVNNSVHHTLLAKRACFCETCITELIPEYVCQTF